MPVKAKDSSIFMAWISTTTVSTTACEPYLRVVQCPFSHKAETGGTKTVLLANFWKDRGTVSISSQFPQFASCWKDNLLHVKQHQRAESLVESSGCMWMYVDDVDVSWKGQHLTNSSPLMTLGVQLAPYIGNNHPNWRTHIFQRGSNHQPDITSVWR